MGFVFGAVVAAAVTYAIVKRRRYHRFWRHGGFYHHPFGPWDGFDGYGSHHGRSQRRRGRFLFGLFRRLDVSPGQEKALIDMVERVRERMDEALPELQSARKDVAAALDSEVLDRSAIDAAFARSAELAEKLSRELREALSSAHELLDPEQRRLLAQWLADGSFGARFRRPYGYGC
jgi:Spy/CpxP family protein refolding chaperone